MGEIQKQKERSIKDKERKIEEAMTGGMSALC
jgi:hypothetical protein